MLGVFILFFLGLEGLFRLALTELPNEIFRRPDPLLHHSLVPNSHGVKRGLEYKVAYRVNSLGLRDREFSSDKPPGVFRILMLGDSFTEGYGVEQAETFSKVLERSLNGGVTGPYQVINAGCASYSPVLEYLLLRHRALAWDPDLVILNYDMSDVQNDYLYSRGLRRDAQGRIVGAGERSLKAYLKSARLFLSRNLASFRWLRHWYKAFASRARPPSADENNTPRPIVKGDIFADSFGHTRDEIDPDWSPYFAVSGEYIRRIAKLLEERGTPFVLTVYPTGHLVNEREWGEGRRRDGFEARTYRSRVFDYLEALARDENIAFLNMLPGFQAAAAEEFPLYLPYDGHWNARGHQVAAALLEQFLKEHNLVPPPVGSASTVGPTPSGEEKPPGAGSSAPPAR